MDNYNSLDSKEGGRACKKMLSISQESYLIGKSGCKGNEERDWSQVSSLSARSGMIRVIHIFAPKIIKTDVGNFRELVQRLTGNTRRSRSGNKSKRSAKSSTSSPPTNVQIVSQYANATKIFASSSRIEYSIPRSPDSYLSPPSILDFYQREQHAKSRARRQSSCIDLSDSRQASCIEFISSSSSNSSSSDLRCYSPFPFAEVTNCARFHGHQSQEQNSINVDCNDGIPNSTTRSCRRQQQQAVSTSAAVVDPFQSLSGYREKLPPTPQRSSSSAFPLFDEISHLMFNSRFNDMDTLTGLVTPGPLRKIPTALAPLTTNSSDCTFQSSL